MSRPALRREERVRIPGRETDIVIGEGIRDELAAALEARFPRAERVGLVLDATVDTLWPLELPDDRYEVIRHLAPPGEAAKRRVVLAELQDDLLDLRRDEPVVAVGGGAVLDVTGFAAATVRRGLPWIALPTTVVGIADASVGGKVAVNHPRGKNLLGTFHPPSLVLADVEFLETLDARDLVAGLAEVYKVAVMGDDTLLAMLREGEPRDASHWVEVMARAVALKCRVVEEDERDAGRRRLLNYGHTIGHALERCLGNATLRHGEAVAIGMAAAARLGAARGEVDAAWVARQDEDLRRLDLDVERPSGADADAVLEAMALDKKRRPGARHVFVLPRQAGGLTVVEDIEDQEVREAYERLPVA